MDTARTGSTVEPVAVEGGREVPHDAGLGLPALFPGPGTEAAHRPVEVDGRGRLRGGTRAEPDVEARAVHTNNPPCGAMRGFGANQANFAMETLLDRLAEQVGIDGWEIRWRNAVEVGDPVGTGQVLAGDANVLAEEAIAGGASRDETLAALAAIEGVYVPSLYRSDPDGPGVVPTGDAPAVVVEVEVVGAGSVGVGPRKAGRDGL